MTLLTKCRKALCKKQNKTKTIEQLLDLIEGEWNYIILSCLGLNLLKLQHKVVVYQK